MKKFALLLVLVFTFVTINAEDGSRLWLRSSTDKNAEVICKIKTPTIDIAVKEIQTQWNGKSVELLLNKSKGIRALGEDGFQISGNKSSKITIESSDEKGLLYGAYHLIRLQETNKDGGDLSITESPKYKLRILNHWDNLDRTVERGYAGNSMWEWDELPGKVSPRYKEYARANASIGINASVLNNVNASAEFLSAEMLQKVKIIADEFRPYKVKVFLSINFSAPEILGGLPTSDPLDKEVNKFWKEKVKEIYKVIPDFGGFLVKANSEGRSGPQDFGRTHVDGANMLADALKPFKGIVMWRAFVYIPGSDDRANQAYLEFMPFDGQFRDNVIIQVKNGPIDFQPREPFSPMFGAMKKTPLMPELQITQEYLGFSNHLVFLASMWEEFLKSDTYCNGEGSTVAKTTDGSIFPFKNTAISGVANIGTDTNWCGHHFAQSNWYAFGRQAWNHELTSAEIADEWIRQTFSKDESAVKQIKKIMLESWETCVSYSMPLGLHHIFEGTHYGPGPWQDREGVRRDWLPPYYHQASKDGIGFDRTKKGSNNVSQYFPPLSDKFNDIKTCPENLILWFHHIPWDHKMKNGKTFWDELCYTYDSGVQNMRKLHKIWDSLEKDIDTERFNHVQTRLKIQSLDAVWWKDACLLYFQTFSNKPIPYDIERPVHSLEELMKLRVIHRHQGESMPNPSPSSRLIVGEQ